MPWKLRATPLLTMRVLLDESVPRRFGFLIEAHYVRTVQQCGWAGLKNGESLRAAQTGFEVLVTADQNMEYQQNSQVLPLSVIVLIASSNHLDALKPLVPRLLACLAEIRAGEFHRIAG